MAPTRPEDTDVQAAFAATLADEWSRCGVAHAVVCPGSRSTPLAVALASHPHIRVHIRLDERSAGFTALGIGKATGAPALVVTTSGTAAVELHPSVVEADLAGVPLIACTADRPPELWDVGAPQTIDQTRLYGQSVRWFAEPGVAEHAARSAWRSLAARAVSESRDGSAGPGPVHLNLSFREPLLGDVDAGGGVEPGRPDGAPWHVVVGAPSRPPGDWLDRAVGSGLLDPGRRGLVVVGADGGAPDAVSALAGALGWPVLADPRSGLRTLDPVVVATADGLLRSTDFARDHRPEVVLCLGERWVSAVVNRFVSAAVRSGAPAVVVDPWGRWPDPDRLASVMVRADPTQFCRSVRSRILDGGDPVPARGSHAPDWLGSWQRAEQRARAVIEGATGIAGPTPGGTAGGTAGGWRDEPSLARQIFECIPSEATLVVSSSMPIRDVEAFGLPRDDPPRVLANRGANGIDGVVSTALGVALAGGGPTVALVGDLAFLHDVSALVGSEEVDPDLTVVVADNSGGGIFSFLAPATALDGRTFDRLFGTPQAADPAAVAGGFGWAVEDIGPQAPPEALDRALRRAVGAGGRAVIRVRLPSREDNVGVHAGINGAIARAVEGGSTA
jgi:2-succinyl-5-enolpyruvyl-6-hydroxy-3-cyclohexene-1-carboxylate synthase